MNRLLVIIAGTTLALASGLSFGAPREFATRLYSRLTGTPLSLTDARRPAIEQAIEAGDYQSAVRIITDDDRFYNVTIRHFASVIPERSENFQATLNDAVAMIIGTTRDDRDFREILSGDYSYSGPTKIGDTALADPVKFGDIHYRQLENGRHNLRQVLERREPQNPEFTDAAGILTSWAWGNAHLNMGTNRRAIEYTFKQFLCTTLDQMGDATITDTRIHRDVDRKPGGNPQTYVNTCRRCHGGMDALVGAFAHFRFGFFPDFQQRTHWDEKIQKKMNQHGDVYKDGFITRNDSWMNHFTKNQNEKIGWRGPLEGRGAHEFGTMIANTKAFPVCMAKRVFTTVCRREPKDDDQSEIAKLSEKFENGGYKMRQLFMDAILIPTCTPPV